MRRGFSIVDLLVSIGIAALLLAILGAVLARSRSAAQNTICLSRLHSISQGFSQYVTDNEGRYPDPFALQRSWEQCIGKDMTDPLLFACPADGEVYPAIGSSYDWRDTGIVATTMAGRTAGDVTRPEAVLSFESLPGWHDKGKMNAVRLDGSAGTMDQERCLSDLQLPIRSSGLSNNGQ
ncbi:MAG TPA: hypothetical protein VFE47_04165 [Tepidisphaeraceae bacterium]|nr:hypothetical protein [Tepidisphaeraceae bacterium]